MKIFILIAIALFTQFATGANIYKYVGKKNHQAQAAELFTFSGVKIIDSIPQLGIYVTDTPLFLNSADFLDLGEVKTLELHKPTAATTRRPWGLNAIHAKEAWALSTGAGIVVAISDTGVDSDHPDLAQNMWQNPGEIGLDKNGKDKSKNKIDDDNNGYVDDVFGWDFVKNQGGGVDHHYHGTHVAGTIAARPTPKLSGVAPDAKIMDVSFLNSKGSGTEVSGAKTIIYAADNGAKIINCSWGAPGKSQVVEDAILYAQQKGVLLVVAAGNESANNDKHEFTPATIDLANVISIGASTLSGKASFSNFGELSVEFAAPGYNILSTSPSSSKTPRYQSLSGTSMASPHAAGVAALVWSVHPNFNWLQVKTRLIETTQKSKAWHKKSISEGVVDAFAAVKD